MSNILYFNSFIIHRNSGNFQSLPMYSNLHNTIPPNTSNPTANTNVKTITTNNVNTTKSLYYSMQSDQFHHQLPIPLHNQHHNLNPHFNHLHSFPHHLQSHPPPPPLHALPTPQSSQNNYNNYNNIQSYQLNKSYPPPPSLYTPIDQQTIQSPNNISSTAPSSSNYYYLHKNKYPSKSPAPLPPPPLSSAHSYSYQQPPSFLASQYSTPSEPNHDNNIDGLKKMPDTNRSQFPINMHSNASKQLYSEYSQLSSSITPTSSSIQQQPQQQQQQQQQQHPQQQQQQQHPQQSQNSSPHSSYCFPPPVTHQILRPQPGHYPDYTLKHDQRGLSTYPPNYGYQSSNQSYLPPPPESLYIATNPYSYSYTQVHQPPPSQSSITSSSTIKNNDTSSKRRYSNSFDDLNVKSTKKSLIAGVVYNSGAVFKRLKPTLKEEKSELVYKQELTRSQGRPFSSNLTGRFIYHEDLKSLLNHVDKRNNNKFIVYDMKNQIKLNNSNGNINGNINHNNGDVSTINKYNSISIHQENNLKNKEDFKITNLLYSKLTGYPDSASNEILVESLDKFLDCKHNDILKIDGYKEQFNPVQKMISYNPTKNKPKHEKKAPKENGSSNTSSSSSSSSSSLSSPSSSPLVDSNEKIMERFNFHNLIKENFGLDEYVLVKTIRDNNGHILKLETIKPPIDKNGKFNYTSEWLKRKICYPRYKGGMNLHILSSDFNFLLYNDIKMLLWDIKEEILSRDENKIRDIFNGSTEVVDDDLKLKLFGNKILYTQTLNR